jgi:CRISPR-associated protein Cas1
MSTLYIDDQGASIRINNNEIVLIVDDEVRERIPKSWVERIVIAGNVSLSPQAMTFLLKEAIPVIFISTKGNYRGCLQPVLHKHASLRMTQYEKFNDNAFRHQMARAFVEAKIKNSRTMLQKHRRSHPEFHCDMELEAMRHELEKLEKTPTLEGIMGHEGVSAHWYFTAFGRMVRREFKFTTRSRRPPKDPVNAMLSLGYTLLHNECVTAVTAIGMDPNIGFMHGIEYGRASLACDMEEEFRWLIDGMVLGIVNRSIIRHEDFIQQDDGGWKLEDAARKKFYAQYEARMQDKVGYRDMHLTYRRIFFHQAQHLARVLKGEEDAYLPHIIQ